MFDFKEIKKITSLFFKNNQKKIDNQKKNNNLDLEIIFNELIEEINTQLNKKHKKVTKSMRDKLPHRRNTWMEL